MNATEWNNEMMEEININVNALIIAINAISEYPVFEDSYGNGVANYDNESFNTYHDLAAHFNLNILDFVKF